MSRHLSVNYSTVYHVDGINSTLLCLWPTAHKYDAIQQSVSIFLMKQLLVLYCLYRLGLDVTSNTNIRSSSECPCYKEEYSRLVQVICICWYFLALISVHSYTSVMIYQSSIERCCGRTKSHFLNPVEVYTYI